LFLTAVAAITHRSIEYPAGRPSAALKENGGEVSR
jgi:hypothetical protein